MTTPLQVIIEDHIAAYGPMPISTFMAMALTHPDHGYYIKQTPFGGGGDFITAPEISQMFGELVGLWCFDQLMQQQRVDEAGLVELGPGRGTLMADILRSIIRFSEQKRWPVHLIETSPTLIREQLENLAAHDVTHAPDLSDLPPYPLAFIANEFFDALPIQQYERIQGQWRERCVIRAADRLVMTLADVSSDDTIPPAPDGSIAEIAPDLALMIDRIARHIVVYGGAALIIDYGKDNALGDSLQAVKAHCPIDILAAPGEVDLSAWVDFGAIRKRANSAGARVLGPLKQGDFLKNLGLYQRADQLSQGADPETRRSLVAAVDRLSSPAQMGDVFKVIAILPQDTRAAIAGFTQF
jgi:NADH dehydrogenase [ubiquinone] 1 alpha subcomplex assembly factor 7